MEETQPVDKEVNLVDKADAVAKRIEEANKVAAELLRRQEEIAARNILGGRSEAGKAEEKKKEVDPREYAKNALKGMV